MHIKWFGQSCFQITVSPKKGEKVDIVIDPLKKETGLKLPSSTPDILLKTSSQLDYQDRAFAFPTTDFSGKEKTFVIDGPGEYEIKGVFVYGISNFDNSQQETKHGQATISTIYTIEAEEMRLCHLDNLTQELSEELLEKIGQVDILMVPVGAGSTINGISAQKITGQLEPRIVLPMHYKIAEAKISPKLENFDNFLKVMGQRPVPQEKLVVKKKDLPTQETKVVLLKP